MMMMASIPGVDIDVCFETACHPVSPELVSCEKTGLLSRGFRSGCLTFLYGLSSPDGESPPSKEK